MAVRCAVSQTPPVSSPLAHLRHGPTGSGRMVGNNRPYFGRLLPTMARSVPSATTPCPWCSSASPTGSRRTSGTTLLTPGAFCTDSWLFGLPVVSAMLANRAGRAGSSRAAKTAACQRERDGPDLTPPGRCDSFGRRNGGKSKRQPQQRGAPTGRPRDATEEPGPPPRSRTGRLFPERGPLRRSRRRPALHGS